ncbi:hypothetical protein SAXI111661_18235 [Saccharomonospora xinjiangensis]|nr:hypothetical protein EYD13_14500 [Saccharomonospora xinjiangensis]
MLCPPSPMQPRGGEERRRPQGNPRGNSKSCIWNQVPLIRGDCGNPSCGEGEDPDQSLMDICVTVEMLNGMKPVRSKIDRGDTSGIAAFRRGEENETSVCSHCPSPFLAHQRPEDDRLFLHLTPKSVQQGPSSCPASILCFRLDLGQRVETDLNSNAHVLAAKGTSTVDPVEVPFSADPLGSGAVRRFRSPRRVVRDLHEPRNPDPRRPPDTRRLRSAASCPAR